MPADMLDKIAALNHLAVADVVQLFLTQALAEEGIQNCEPSNVRSPARFDLPAKTRCRQRELLGFARSSSTMLVAGVAHGSWSTNKLGRRVSFPRGGWSLGRASGDSKE